MLWDKERTEWITNGDKKICPQGVCCLCTHFYPLTTSVFLGATLFPLFLLKDWNKSKLSCHRQLAIKDEHILSHYSIFLAFVKRLPHWYLLLKLILKEPFKKMTLPQAMTGLSWCLCLHSVFENLQFFVWNFVLWKHTIDNYQYDSVWLSMTFVIAS